jgi:hypothetical protein
MYNPSSGSISGFNKYLPFGKKVILGYICLFASNKFGQIDSVNANPILKSGFILMCRIDQKQVAASKCYYWESVWHSCGDGG